MKKSRFSSIPERSLRRNSPSRDPIHLMYIITEGKVTEKRYFERYHKCLEGPKVALAPIDGASGTPKTIVEKCIEKRKALKSKGGGDSFSKNFSVWAVFDVDEHPFLNEAILLARENNIEVVISNPCFEVWGLMHDKRYDKPMSRHDAQHQLRVVMPNYHHETNPDFNWAWCSARIEQVMRNAKAAVRMRFEEGVSFPYANPGTNVFELLEKMKL